MSKIVREETEIGRGAREGSMPLKQWFSYCDTRGSMGGGMLNKDIKRTPSIEGDKTVWTITHDNQAIAEGMALENSNNDETWDAGIGCDVEDVTWEIEDKIITVTWTEIRYNRFSDGGKD